MVIAFVTEAKYHGVIFDLKIMWNLNKFAYKSTIAVSCGRV